MLICSISLFRKFQEILKKENARNREILKSVEYHPYSAFTSKRTFVDVLVYPFQAIYAMCL